MAHFFIDNFPQTDGNHEVHLVGCKRMPTDKRYLGNCFSVSEALIEARKEFWMSSGCERCAREIPGTGSIGRIVGSGVSAVGQVPLISSSFSRWPVRVPGIAHARENRRAGCAAR